MCFFSGEKGCSFSSACLLSCEAPVQLDLRHILHHHCSSHLELKKTLEEKRVASRGGYAIIAPYTTDSTTSFCYHYNVIIISHYNLFSNIKYDEVKKLISFSYHLPFCLTESFKCSWRQFQSGQKKRWNVNVMISNSIQIRRPFSTPYLRFKLVLMRGVVTIPHVQSKWHRCFSNANALEQKSGKDHWWCSWSSAANLREPPRQQR